MYIIKDLTIYDNTNNKQALILQKITDTNESVSDSLILKDQYNLHDTRLTVNVFVNRHINDINNKSYKLIEFRIIFNKFVIINELYNIRVFFESNELQIIDNLTHLLGFVTIIISIKGKETILNNNIDTNAVYINIDDLLDSIKKLLLSDEMNSINADLILNCQNQIEKRFNSDFYKYTTIPQTTLSLNDLNKY